MAIIPAMTTVWRDGICNEYLHFLISTNSCFRQKWVYQLTTWNDRFHNQLRSHHWHGGNSGSGFSCKEKRSLEANIFIFLYCSSQQNAIYSLYSEFKADKIERTGSISSAQRTEDNSWDSAHSGGWGKWIRLVFKGSIFISLEDKSTIGTKRLAIPFPCLTGIFKWLQLIPTNGFLGTGESVILGF